MKRQNVVQPILMLACCALLLAASQFSLKISAQESFQATAVSLKPEPAKYFKCPAHIVFNGYITANAAGTVKYTFTSSDEGEEDTRTLEFKKAGTMPVSTTWDIGNARRATDYEGWKAIKILSPNEMESSHADGAFAVHCKGAAASGLTVNEKIELKKGEKFERDGLIESAQKSYVYSVHLEKGRGVNLAAVFRGNFQEQKPNSVFRYNTIPAFEVRGIYKGGDADAPLLVGSAGKDGKWSGTIQEPGDYLIVVSRPSAKDGDSGAQQVVYPYKLLVWTN